MKTSAERRAPYAATSLLALLALVAGCGGGGGGSSVGASALSASAPSPSLARGTQGNVLAIAVGRANKVNLPMASVTVCVPAGGSCQTVDNVLIDTGSTGLRIVASAISGLALTAQNDAIGNAIAVCAQFADGYAWGSVRTADVNIAGETAVALPVQVIADPAVPPAPAACTNTGRAIDLVRDLGANGILGINAFRRDCGLSCEQSASMGIYYACTSSGCQPAMHSVARQVANPVALFAANNNGIIVQLPAVPASGAPRVEGTLVFGINTQDNNDIGQVTSVYSISMLTGGVVTYYKGEVFDHSFFDTGSNALFFKDASIPTCASGSGFFCAPSPQSLVATVQGMNGTNTNVSFTVDNADSLIATGSSAFNNLGAPVWSALTFDWGLPFFYGRRVFVAIEGASVRGEQNGPFVAF